MLKEKINEDLTAALKSGSGDIVSALRFLFSVIKNKELEKRTKLSKENKPVEELEKLSELSDDETVSAILGEIKKHKESIIQYEKGGRKDLAGKETKKLEIIKKYSPEKIKKKKKPIIKKEKAAEKN